MLTTEVNGKKGIEKTSLKYLNKNSIIVNLYENSYINEDQYEEFIKKDISLKKRKIKLLEEANFYSEEVRRIVSDTYGYDNLYKGGLSIRTPLKSSHQIEALKALSYGLEKYDRRHGWRGVLANIKNKDWKKKIDKYFIDQSLEWKIARVEKVEKLSVKIETEDN